MDRSRERDRNKGKSGNNRNNKKDKRNNKNKAFGNSNKNDKYGGNKKRGLFGSSASGTSGSRRKEEAMRHAEQKERRSGQSFEAMGYRGKNKTGLYEHDLEKGLGAGHVRDEKSKGSASAKKGLICDDEEEEYEPDSSRHIDDIPYTREESPSMDDDDDSDEFNSFSDLDEEMGLTTVLDQQPTPSVDTRPKTLGIPANDSRNTHLQPHCPAEPSVPPSGTRKETPVALAAAAAAAAATNDKPGSGAAAPSPQNETAAANATNKHLQVTSRTMPTDKHPLENHATDKASEPISANHIPASPTSVSSGAPLLSREMSRKSTTTNKSESTSEKQEGKSGPQISVRMINPDDMDDECEADVDRGILRGSEPYKMTQVKLILFCGLGVFILGILLVVFGGIVSWGLNLLHFTLMIASGVVFVGIVVMISSLIVKVKRKNHPKKSLEELCSAPQCAQGVERDDESGTQSKAPLVRSEIVEDDTT